MLKKKALIIGLSGQDGSFLAEFLLKKGYVVHGSSRDAQQVEFKGLSLLGIKEEVELHSLNTKDFRNILQVMKKIKPDEIYNLSGQSSVGLSFDQPVETFDSIAVATVNLLEAIRYLQFPVKFYNAGSSECFGETPKDGATENTPFMPMSPYATAKAASYWQVLNYRKAYDLYCCTGLLFNHESFLRPQRFVTQKIIKTAIDISKGRSKNIVLGNLNVYRDWGWAPEYIEAMWLMLQQQNPDDYIVSSGQAFSLRDFAKITFGQLNLDLEEHLVIDSSLFRPSDIAFSLGNPTKAKSQMGWESKVKIDEVISRMIQFQLSHNGDE